MYEWPLINDNISEDDKNKLVEFFMNCPSFPKPAKVK